MAAAFAAAYACAGSDASLPPVPAPNPSPDAGPDAGPDAAPDAPLDGGPDAPTEPPACPTQWAASVCGDGVLGVEFCPSELATVAPTDAFSLMAGDFDGDGRPDLLTNKNKILRGLGERAFAAAVAVDVGGCGIYDVADVNGDGRSDAIGYSGGKLCVAISNGDLSFTTHIGGTTVAYPRAPTVIDIDADGDLDVLAVGTQQNALAIWRNNGGVFGEPQLYPTNNGPNSVAAGEFTQPGRVDVWISYFGADESRVYMIDGDHLTQVGETNPDSFSENNAVADLDGDGDPDVLTASFGTAFLVGLNLHGALSNRFQYTPSISLVRVTMGDVDNDGHQDIFGRSQNLRMRAFATTGYDETFSFEDLPWTPNTEFLPDGVTDLDGNCKADIFGVWNGNVAVYWGEY